MKQSDCRYWSLDTLLVHGEAQSIQHPEPGALYQAGTPTVQPIYTSTAYLHADVAALDQACNAPLSSNTRPFVYARQGNPNTQSLENVLSQAERGVGAVVLSSGMAAIQTALMAALSPGAKILVTRDIYGSTLTLLHQLFAPMGVEIVIQNLCGPDAAEIIHAERPDVIYVETLSNPLVKVIDLEAISAAAHEVNAITIVDSTFTTPYLIQPLAHGFDLVIHSATKYICGHGDSAAGVVISARHSLLERMRSYAALLGAALSPFESYLISRGLKTLSLRMERHCANAQRIAHFLQQHPAVERVYYPGLADHPQHELASSLLKKGHYGGILSFELREQARSAAFRFMDALRLCLPVATLGDVQSQVSYPPISSHYGFSAAERQQAGITDGCIRLSAGIEDVEDIIDDLAQALEGVTPAQEEEIKIDAAQSILRAYASSQV